MLKLKIFTQNFSSATDSVFLESYDESIANPLQQIHNKSTYLTILLKSKFVEVDNAFNVAYVFLEFCRTI